MEELSAEHRRIEALPVSEVPELVAAWRDERPFDGLKVIDVFGGPLGSYLGTTYSLRCPNDHKLDSVVSSFLFMGCPYCRGKETRKTTKQTVVADADPELAMLWHPTRNGSMTPQNTSISYLKALWWKSSQCCGHEWQEPMKERTLGRRPQAGRGHYLCPRCESVWGSLAWSDPELAAEWHPDNDLTPWHVKPFSSGVTVKWVCSADSEHAWQASVVDRSSGRLCPQCSTAGTSQIEKAFLAAIQEHDPAASAERVDRWRVDVLAPSANLIVEYDGEYWHGGKLEIDTRKTLDLVRRGYKVARIRENDLPHLDLTDPRVLQVSFRPAFGQVEATAHELMAWAIASDPRV